MTIFSNANTCAQVRIIFAIICLWKSTAHTLTNRNIGRVWTNSVETSARASGAFCVNLRCCIRVSFATVHQQFHPSWLPNRPNLVEIIEHRWGNTCPLLAFLPYIIIMKTTMATLASDDHWSWHYIWRHTRIRKYESCSVQWNVKKWIFKLAFSHLRNIIGTWILPLIFSCNSPITVYFRHVMYEMGIL